MRKWITLALLGLTSWAQAAVVEYDASVGDNLKREVEEVLTLLPYGYLDSSRGKITIKVEPLRGDLNIIDDLCEIQLDEDEYFATTRKRRDNHTITFSSRFIEVADTNFQSFDCSHGSFQNLLKATIIHELTHVKDNFERISTEPDFQRIVGMKKIQRSSKKALMNQNTSASPDAYEFKNLEEALAVNVEYLILDREFECRKPATANYLSRRLGIPLRRFCSKSFMVMTQSAYLEDNYQHTLSLDPKKIYQVHYLFAGKGQGIMSRWGHAMFRLVVCAPHRETVGPECMNDVSHHVALSYRAYMTDPNVSYVGGLFGKYPSQLFIMRFHEVQQEYTKYELRDLYSIPLNLTELQKADFIDLTLERYWTYQGKYYFINNNCGTEAQRHLAVALDEEQSQLIRSITPDRIYRDIVREENNLSDEGIGDLERQEMIDGGFLISSMFEEFNRTYQELRTAGLFSEKKFKNFLKKFNAGRRLQLYQDFMASASLEGEELRILTLKLIHLERYMTSRYLMSLPQEAMKKINRDRHIRDEVLRMGESMRGLTMQPWQVVDSAYGVPTFEEFSFQYPEFREKRREEMRSSAEEQMRNLESLLGRRHFEEELAEIENLKLIKEFTNELFLQVLGLG